MQIKMVCLDAEMGSHLPRLGVLSDRRRKRGYGASRAPSGELVCDDPISGGGPDQADEMSDRHLVVDTVIQLVSLC
jgi:hypothetical protein